MTEKVVIAEHDYDGQDENQLSFAAGDRIIVTEEDESGWWTGRLEKNGKDGYFPETFVRAVTAADEAPSRAPPPPPNNSSSTGNTGSHKKKEHLNSYSVTASVQSGSTNKLNKSSNISQNTGAKQSSAKASIGGSQIDPSAENYYAAGMLNLKVNPNSKTRFGMASHYMSFASCITSFFLGIAACEWSGGPELLGAQRDICIYVGIYLILVSMGMFAWEYLRGVQRSRKSLPFRGILYCLIGVFPATTLVTAMASGQWIITGIFDIMAWIKYEEYTSKVKKSDKDAANDIMAEIMKYVTPNYYIEKTTSWFTDLRQQSKVKKYLFVLVFLLFNIIYVIERCVFYSNVVADPSLAGYDDDTVTTFSEKNGGNGILTGWFPVAKMFGNLLDINCAFILFPVCRSFIRYLYNISTDQRAAARVCNVILSFMPLDKAIQWHKMMAGLIVIGAIFHTWAHFMHYGQVPYTYDEVFGPTVWISGVIIILCMQFIFCTSFMAVRHGKFELFWYTHHLFVVFFITILFHGKNSLNPNFGYWFLVPGLMYLIERTLREIRSRQAVGVVSVTHLNNKAAKVFCLELEKTGPIKKHQEGQYIFIKAPIITKFQWHPFTISSPPDQKTLTLHIRNMGNGTWTDRLQRFFQSMSPKKAYYEAYHRDGNTLVPQKVGPDGNSLICVDGPMAAPTQHLGEYSTAIIVGAGIGVTPVRATLQSIIYYRFKRGIGRSYPDHAYCVWIVNYTQLDAYRFMVRSLKEAEDELYDMRKKNAGAMKDKIIQMHIFVTRVPKEGGICDESEVTTPAGDRDADLAMWGPHYDDLTHDDSNVAQEKAPFNEIDIWRVLKQPKASQPTQIGDIIVHNGRPKWPEFFGPIQQAHQGDRIGVMFCGPDIIAKDLKKNCGHFTDFNTSTIFMMHKENF